MKIKSITPVGNHAVYDISVNNVEHYILENGVVTHNTGPMYAGDRIFVIGRQQEKDGTEISGYNFIINVEKSRFVKEKSKIPITVSHEHGIGKFSGLMDIAVEGGFVDNSSKGWYSKIDRKTGEVLKKTRLTDTYNNEFWKDILGDDEFDRYVREKYQVAYKSIMGGDDEPEKIVDEGV
jgi:hypothetical protein